MTDPVQTPIQPDPLIAANITAMEDQAKAIREWIKAEGERAAANQQGRLAYFVSQTLAALAGSPHPPSEFQTRADEVVRLLEFYAAVPSSAQVAPAPAPEVKPPKLLNAEQLAFYLREMGPELLRYGRPATLEEAQSHWVTYALPEWSEKGFGRKWAPDSPGWGPAVSKDDPRWAPKG